MLPPWLRRFQSLLYCSIFSPFTLVQTLFVFSLLGLSIDLQAQRTYNLPKEPVEFTRQQVYRPNALDLLLTPHGYFFLRYQRAINPHFSFMFDFNSYVPNLLFSAYSTLFANAEEFPLGSIESNLHIGTGIGIAFWPQGILRKAYLALRSQIQIQTMDISIGNSEIKQDRIIVSSNVEIGTRLGRKVASAGLFGGLGFQVPTDSRTILPEDYRLSIIFVYFGFSFGLTFR